MGDLRNNLRHHGMLATSGSWRRHWHILRPEPARTSELHFGTVSRKPGADLPTVPLWLLQAAAEAWRRIVQAQLALLRFWRLA